MPRRAPAPRATSPAELLKLYAGIDIVHVPYKGAAPAAQDLAAGHVSMMFDVVSLALPSIKAGRVRPLGVAAKERVAVLPDVPTLTSGHCRPRSAPGSACWARPERQAGRPSPGSTAKRPRCSRCRTRATASSSRAPRCRSARRSIRQVHRDGIGPLRRHHQAARHQAGSECRIPGGGRRLPKSGFCSIGIRSASAMGVEHPAQHRRSRIIGCGVPSANRP